MITSYVSEGMLGRAVERKLLDVRVTDIRDFTTDRHRSVDDAPYGGGAGMIFKVEPIARAIQHVKADGLRRHTVLLTPGGTLFNQKKAASLLQYGALLLICGRYEGVDERVVELVDEEISIGDYVLTGGELAALVIIDSVSRLVPGVLGNECSARFESFSNGPERSGGPAAGAATSAGAATTAGAATSVTTATSAGADDPKILVGSNRSMGLVEYPQYTRPAVFGGLDAAGLDAAGLDVSGVNVPGMDVLGITVPVMAVPDVLLSGNHAEIARWRKKSALKKTLANRPYLLADLIANGLTIEESELLEEIKKEIKEEIKEDMQNESLNRS
jgi:tRNA (guanine37-N1)-methyltransferase